MKHACKDCKHSQSGWTFRVSDNTSTYKNMCNHPSCFVDRFEPWMGEVKRRRISDYETNNFDGACPDYEEKE